jgi:hypothetical protein
MAKKKKQRHASKSGLCRLCGVDGPLINSHIVPAAAYDRVSDRDATHPAHRNPVQVTRGASVLTSQHWRAYLLCRTCEERFGVWEAYSFPQLAQPDGSFPWLSQVRKLDTRAADPDTGHVAISEGVNVPTLSLFAVSIFWRLGVFDTSKSLGAEESACRKYLLRQSNFPERATLMVRLLDSSAVRIGRVDRAITTYETALGDGYFLHRLLLLGAEFRLFLGAQASTLRVLCFARTGVAVVAPSDTIARELQDFAQSSEAKGALARQPPRV